MDLVPTLQTSRRRWSIGIPCGSDSVFQTYNSHCFVSLNFLDPRPPKRLGVLVGPEGRWVVGMG